MRGIAANPPAEEMAIHLRRGRALQYIHEGSRFVGHGLVDPQVSHLPLAYPGMMLTGDTSSDHVLLGPGLLSVRGETHRKQRKLLTPVFSTKHLRNMTPIFYSVGHNVCSSSCAPQ